MGALPVLDRAVLAPQKVVAARDHVVQLHELRLVDVDAQPGRGGRWVVDTARAVRARAALPRVVLREDVAVDDAVLEALPEIVILFGLARRTARQIEKVSLFYQLGLTSSTSQYAMPLQFFGIAVTFHGPEA